MILILFFIYIFPLFFYYMGIWISHPILATSSLIIGIIGWILFNFTLFKSLIIDLNKVAKRQQEIAYKGKPVMGIVTEKFEKSINKKGHKFLEIVIEFENHSGTIVEASLPLEDTRPNENRFEVGNKIQLRLNYEDKSPPFTLEESKTEHSKSLVCFWILFNTGYAIVTFLLSYNFLNKGLGWRYLSPLFPWVWTPFLGILMLGGLGQLGLSNGIVKNAMEGLKKEEDINRLLLYGRKAKANVFKANQTGMYLNEQPELEFRMNFTDFKGTVHHKSFKRYVLLTDLHKAQKGEKEIIYLPENPDVFDFI